MSEVIYSYTREQAIEDGVLVDISHTSEVKEARFKAPVCMTDHLWKKVRDCSVPGQDWHGRLWDVCYLASLSFRKKLHAGADCHLVEFRVLFAEDRQASKRLWLVFNEYEGFTIMFPEDY